jgi:hypothetical protein
MGLVGTCSETDEADSDVKVVSGFGVCLKDDARVMKRREVEQMSDKEASDAASAVILENVKATKPSTVVGLPVDAANGDEMFLCKGTKESFAVKGETIYPGNPIVAEAVQKSGTLAFAFLEEGNHFVV